MEKGSHDWQQADGEAVNLISALTLPGDPVVDPCIGPGFTAIACQGTGRRFIGCDIDEYEVNESMRRLEEAGKGSAGKELMLQALKN